jgi:GntR family transcriptional regulator/MocR family aminotransferase
VLSAARRTSLLEWADDRDALIIEHDYDSELRLGGEAVGALQGLSPERVAHVGSFDVRLAPAIGLGWILSPSWLTGGLSYERGVTGGPPPALDQLALADFITRGELDRHLRRTRLELRARRRALLAALAGQLPRARPIGVAAGLFSAVELELPASGAAIAAAAAAAGIGLEAYDGPGLVLGLGAIAEPVLERAVAALTEVIDGYRSTD